MLITVMVVMILIGVSTIIIGIHLFMASEEKLNDDYFCGIPEHEKID